jgi:hypothetical protein
MVLAYWDLEVSQEKIARQLKTIPGAGTPGSRLQLLASRSLKVEYRAGALADLQFALTQGFPPIVLLHTSQLPEWNSATPHAVVILEIAGDFVAMNDPGMLQAPVRAKVGDFELAWDVMDNLYAVIRKTS